MKALMILIGVILNISIANAECVSFGTRFDAQTKAQGNSIKNNKPNKKDQVSIPRSGPGSNDCLTIKPEDPELYSAIAPKLPEKKEIVAMAETNGKSSPQQTDIDGNVEFRTAKVEPPKPIPVWTLRAGKMIGGELQEWGPRELCPTKGPKEGWTVVWQVPKDWNVAANATFSGDFKTASTQVINSLAENGAIIRARYHDSNCTLVVSGPGVVAK